MMPRSEWRFGSIAMRGRVTDQHIGLMNLIPLYSVAATLVGATCKSAKRRCLPPRRRAPSMPANRRCSREAKADGFSCALFYSANAPQAALANLGLGGCNTEAVTCPKRPLHRGRRVGARARRPAATAAAYDEGRPSSARPGCGCPRSRPALYHASTASPTPCASDSGALSV